MKGDRTPVPYGRRRWVLLGQAVKRGGFRRSPRSLESARGSLPAGPDAGYPCHTIPSRPAGAWISECPPSHLNPPASRPRLVTKPGGCWRSSFTLTAAPSVAPKGRQQPVDKRGSPRGCGRPIQASAAEIRVLTGPVIEMRVAGCAACSSRLLVRDLMARSS